MKMFVKINMTHEFTYVCKYTCTHTYKRYFHHTL